MAQQGRRRRARSQVHALVVLSQLLDAIARAPCPGRGEPGASSTGPLPIAGRHRGEVAGTELARSDGLLITRADAAYGGSLEALKFLRSQDPPCPWDENTCTWAARGGHLEVLKFARGQDPPCPWIRSDCRAAARLSDHQHVIDWMDQQEDESNVE